MYLIYLLYLEKNICQTLISLSSPDLLGAFLSLGFSFGDL